MLILPRWTVKAAVAVCFAELGLVAYGMNRFNKMDDNQPLRRMMYKRDGFMDRTMLEMYWNYNNFSNPELRLREQDLQHFHETDDY